MPKAYLVAPEHFNELDEASSEVLSTRTEDVFPEDASQASEPAAGVPEGEHEGAEPPEGAEWQVVHLNQHVYTACFSAKCSECSPAAEECSLGQAMFWGYQPCPRCSPSWCSNAPAPRILDPTRTAQSSSASGPSVLSSQTVLGSWLHIDDAVVAAAAEPPDPQAVPLGDAAENHPDSEVDNLESGTNASEDTPRTRIHYSDVD